MTQRPKAGNSQRRPAAIRAPADRKPIRQQDVITASLESEALQAALIALRASEIDLARSARAGRQHVPDQRDDQAPVADELPEHLMRLSQDSVHVRLVEPVS